MEKKNLDSRKKSYRFVVKSVSLIIIGAMCVGAFIGTAYLCIIPPPDLNTGLNFENEDALRVFNGSNWVLYISEVVNQTSDRSITIYFYVNRSQYNDLRLVTMYYYNGSHGDNYDPNASMEQNYWNYDHWWTGERDLYVPWLNTTSPEALIFTIPRQRGNTTVTFQLALGEWNGSQIVYTNYNGTFNVLFSQAEVVALQYKYMVLRVYWGATLAALTILLFLVYYSERIWPSYKIKPPLAQQEYTKENKIFLISRSDYLDQQINTLRTAATLFFGIGTGFLYWQFNLSLQYHLVFTSTVFSSLTYGLFMMTIFGFIANLYSYKTVHSVIDGYQMNHALLPQGQDPRLYLTQVNDILYQKLNIIENVKIALGMGLLTVITTVLMSFIFTLLPDSAIFTGELPSEILVLVAYIASVLDATGVVLAGLGSKGLGFFPSDSDVIEK